MNKVSIFVTVGVLFLAGFGVLLFSNSSTGSKESGKVFPQAQLSLVKENFSAL